MEVYVDKLPESCNECPMCRCSSVKLNRNGRYIEAHECVFGQYKYQTIDDDIDTCPLKTIEELKTRIAELEDKDWFEKTIKQLENQNDSLVRERDLLEKTLDLMCKKLENVIERKTDCKDVCPLYDTDCYLDKRECYEKIKDCFKKKAKEELDEKKGNL